MSEHGVEAEVSGMEATTCCEDSAMNVEPRNFGHESHIGYINGDGKRKDGERFAEAIETVR